MNKTCNLKMVGSKCYFTLIDCNSDELMDIINHKSWILRSYKVGKERKYFVYIYKDREDEKIVWCSIGFSSLLVRYLESLGYIVNGKELFKSRKIFVGKPYYNLWDFQSDAVNSWINSGGCGVIKSPTGSGKSVLACNIINKLSLRTIICVHTSDLLVNVWFNNLVEQFGEVVKSKIGIIGGGITKKQRMRMRVIKNIDFNSNINKDIVIASSQTMVNNLDKLSNENFGLLILDEIHRYPALQFSKVVGAIKSPYRLGLTATTVRLDGASPMIYGLSGDIVYRVSIRDLVMKKRLVEPLFKTIVVNDDESQNKIKNCGLTRLEFSRYLKSVSAKSVIKKNYIMKLVESLYINNKKFLLYVDYVTEGDGIFTRDYYTRELIKKGIRVYSVTSKMDSNEREYLFNMLKKSEIDGLVFGKLGSEGINVPNVDSIVMSNSTKSTILFPQRTGRAMRKGSVKDNKKYAYIYEMLLNTEKELEWSKYNFYEYLTEGYYKEFVYINGNDNISI